MTIFYMHYTMQIICACRPVFYLYQNYSPVQGPVVQKYCWSKKKLGGPSQDEIVEYTKNNTKRVVSLVTMKYC